LAPAGETISTVATGMTSSKVVAATSDDGAGNTVITLDGDDSLTLIGVQEAQLHEDDFIL
jgi:hypothetical protein